MFRRKGERLGLIGIALVVGAFAGFFLRPAPAPQALIQSVPVPVGSMGWVSDPEAVAAVVASLPVKSFSDTPAFRGPEPDQVFLWEAARKALGKLIPCRNQGAVGSCVSFGSACAIEYLECVQIAVEGRQEEYKDISQEVIYGGSRVQIGGGRIRGDGSVGAWAVQFGQKYGEVARGKYPGIDLTAYSEQTCRQMGRNGVPADLLTVAKDRIIKSGTPVKNIEECRKALASGYPVTVASDQGFSMSRDRDGFAAARGTWGHQMCILGYQKGLRPGFWIQNSWGSDAFSGPAGAGNPPDGGFWADANVVEGMLEQGDSWAYADLNGFPRRQLDDWFTRLPIKRWSPETVFALGF